MILTKFEQLFDDAADEEELCTFLGSPTRQAVSLARTYNSRERKLQISSTSREDDMYESDGEEQSPAFVQVIEQLREEAAERGYLSRKKEKRSVWSAPVAEPAPEQSFVPEPPREMKKSLPEEPDKKLEYVKPEEEELVFDDVPPVPARSVPEQKKEVIPVPKVEQSELDDDLAMLKTPNASNGHRKSDLGQEEHKTIIPLAILFAIIAVPVTLALSCILLIPTFASLGLSGLCLFVGAKVTVAAFAGFSLFSDMMVVLGCGVIVLALGLLFLWLFIWFVGGVIAGLIDAVIQLGGKWCSKEVR